MTAPNRDAATWQDFRIERDSDGSLRLRGHDGAYEPICPECGEPIRWVLDMASWKHEPGSFVLCHARCVWTPEAFTDEATRAES